MAGVAKKDEVLDFKASSKSPADIEAEIAAAASAIAGATTVGGVSVPEYEVTQSSPTQVQDFQHESRPKESSKAGLAKQEDNLQKTDTKAKKKSVKKAPKKSSQKASSTPKSSKSKSKKTAKSKTDAASKSKKAAQKSAAKKHAEAHSSASVASISSSPKKQSHKGKVLPTSDVRPRSKSETTKKASVTFEDEDAPSAVRVTVMPGRGAVADANKEEASPKKEVLSRHGKTIEPLHEDVAVAPPAIGESTVAEAKTESKPPAKPVAIKTHTRVKAKPIEHPPSKPYQVIHKPLPEAMNESADMAQRHHEKHTPHVARIYDTHTYHIPLSVDHHHRKSMFPVWGWAAIIAVGVIGMVLIGLAFDMINI